MNMNKVHYNVRCSSGVLFCYFGFDLLQKCRLSGFFFQAGAWDRQNMHMRLIRCPEVDF